MAETGDLFQLVHLSPPPTLLQISGGQHRKLVQTYSLQPPPLRPHADMWWQVGSTHPPGIVSCAQSLCFAKNGGKMGKQPVSKSVVFYYWNTSDLCTGYTL